MFVVHVSVVYRRTWCETKIVGIFPTLETAQRGLLKYLALNNYIFHVECDVYENLPDKLCDVCIDEKITKITKFFNSPRGESIKEFITKSSHNSQLGSLRELSGKQFNYGISDVSISQK